MFNKRYTLAYVVLGGIVSLLLFTSPAVYAKNAFSKRPDAVRTTGQTTPAPTPRPTAVFREIRLTGGPLQACKAHEAVIQTRLKSLLRYAAAMEGTFDRIATRVQEYYTGTVKPGGRTVSDYDSLLSDIQAKKTIVRQDLTTAKSDSEGFVCDGIDPKGHLLQFRTDMQEVKNSLKNYRTAVKNLIVAVRGTQPEKITPTITGGAK